MANGDVPFMWIKAGSLLDDASMAAIRTLADEHGLQVFVERVGSEPGAIELTEHNVEQLADTLETRLAAETKGTA